MRWTSSSSYRAKWRAPATDEFYTWVLSLPWVVERPRFSEGLGVRAFAIKCEPLEIRQLWLVTGVASRIAVVVPVQMAQRYEADGLGRAISPMPADHTLFGVDDDARAIDLERVVLEAYGVALAP
jgi:hypothetical protein